MEEKETNSEGISCQEYKLPAKQGKSCSCIEIREALFVLVAFTYLVIGVIHFLGLAGDISMLTTLLEYTAGYAGIKEIPLLLPWRRKGDQTSTATKPEGEEGTGKQT